MITFIAVALSISGLIHWFLYARFVAAFGITAPQLLWLLRGVATLLAVSYLIARNLEYSGAPWQLVTTAHWISCVWLGFMLQFFWMGLTGMLVKAGLVMTGEWARMGPLNQAALGRNVGLLAIAAATLLCGYALWRAAAPAELVRFKVPVKSITDELRKLKIVLVSDLHAGILVNERQLNRMVEQVNSLKPDVILIPGDIIDAPARLLGNLPPYFARLTAPLGVFGTTGNHEYYIGLGGALDLLARSNVTVLMNSQVELPNGLLIAGIEDRTAGQMGLPRPPVEQVLGPRAKALPTILLDHTPGTAEVNRATQAGADLVVSGHTHGGQMWPFNYLVKRAFPYLHGLYPTPGGNVITTCGIGYWGPPMRLGASPEIVIISLTGMDESYENPPNPGVVKPSRESEVDER
ncbi:metallophosphoesterase [candidate division KSB1 bacterium]|nr:metallophosphoesterase [candidate division KSB1 bacterium]